MYPALVSDVDVESLHPFLVPVLGHFASRLLIFVDRYRYLRSGSGTETVSTLGVVITGGSVVADAVVPVDDCILVPVDADLYVGRRFDLTPDHVKDGVGFMLGNADDTASVGRVDVQSFDAGDGVNTNDGMDTIGLGTADVGTSILRPLLLMVRGVDGGEAFEILDEIGGEGGEESLRVGPDGVASAGWRIDDFEGGKAHRVDLVRLVRVPGDAAATKPVGGFAAVVPDDMNAIQGGIAWYSGSGVNVKGPVVQGDVEHFVNTGGLVAENENATLGTEESPKPLSSQHIRMTRLERALTFHPSAGR